MTDYEKAYRDLRAGVEALADHYASMVVASTAYPPAVAERVRNLLAPAPASEPLGPTAEVSPSPKAAQSPASETAREDEPEPQWCGDCGSRWNLVVMGAPGSGQYWLHPDCGWRSPGAPTPPTTVQADRDAATEPAIPLQVATHAATQADRDATYQPCSHECNGCPACDPGLAQADRDAGQVRLTEEELDSVRGQSDDPAVVQHRLSKLLDALAANPGTSRHAADIRAYQADAARRHWLLETLEHAAEEWDAKPEWTKPVVNAPYYAQRADQTRRVVHFYGQPLLTACGERREHVRWSDRLNEVTCPECPNDLDIDRAKS